ncbi:hypothetical protein NKG94_34715 [Micromonospora sp. M12]
MHAEAQLRVRLEQLTRILGRALDTLDNNPTSSRRSLGQPVQAWTT